MFDFDTIDEWEPHIAKVLAPLLPVDIAERVRREKPEYVEDARDIVIQYGDIGKIGIAILGWLERSTVLAYHGTRLTPEEAASVERDGFLPLKVANRKTRLERALAGHPQWPQAIARLEEVFADYASGCAGAREGQVHFTLSRAGLGSFDHYITHGAEVDHHIARELVGNDAFNVRITDNRTDIDLIKANGLNDEVQRWNPRLEQRLDHIEATNAVQNTNISHVNTVNNQQDVRITNLEGRPAGSLAFAGEASLAAAVGTRTSSAVVADFCILSQVTFSTVADNHNHTCTINRSGRSHTVTASGVGGQQACRITCYNLE